MQIKTMCANTHSEAKHLINLAYKKIKILISIHLIGSILSFV